MFEVSHDMIFDYKVQDNVNEDLLLYLLSFLSVRFGKTG